ncbi:MAG: peptide deformylase [Acidobacteriota bacterium]
MSILKIVTMGHEALTKEAEPVTDWGDRLELLVRDMQETMLFARGVGLAANQVGLPDNLTIIDINAGTSKSELFVLTNPEIVESSGQVKEEEGCLSIPGFMVEVVRPEKVVVKYQDERSDEQFIEASGLMARALCHELDHLNGRLFIENLKGLKGDMARRKAKKMQRRGEFDDYYEYPDES